MGEEKKLKVLIYDDEALIREVLRDMINNRITSQFSGQEVRYETLATGDFKEAKRIMEEENPQYLITDLMIEGRKEEEQGEALIKQASEIRRDLEIIAISGYYGERLIPLSYQFPHLETLQKPFGYNETKNMIERYLSNWLTKPEEKKERKPRVIIYTKNSKRIEEKIKEEELEIIIAKKEEEITRIQEEKTIDAVIAEGEIYKNEIIRKDPGISILEISDSEKLLEGKKVRTIITRKGERTEMFENYKEIMKRIEKYQEQETKGTLYIIGGPSGAGKTTLTKEIRNELSDLNGGEIIVPRLITTRKPRKNEDEEIETISLEEIIKRKEEFWFIRKNYDHHYALPKKMIDELNQGRSYLITINNPHTIRRLKEKIEKQGINIYIHILLPEQEVLKKRLKSDRNRSKKERIERIEKMNGIYNDFQALIREGKINSYSTKGEYHAEEDRIMKSLEEEKRIMLDEAIKYISKI